RQVHALLALDDLMSLEDALDDQVGVPLFEPGIRRLGVFEMPEEDKLRFIELIQDRHPTRRVAAMRTCGGESRDAQQNDHGETRTNGIHRSVSRALDFDPV